MSNTIIVDNEFITIQYLIDKGIIYHTIHQPFVGQPMRDALNAATDSSGIMARLSGCRMIVKMDHFLSKT